MGILQGFKVHYVKQDGVDYAVVTVGANTSTITLANVQPYANYNITVGAFTQAGETKSSPVIVVTLQDGRFYSRLFISPKKTGRSRNKICSFYVNPAIVTRNLS